MRAYEVKKFTNKSLFEFTKETKANFDNNIFKKLFINIPRELLHKKIEKRVEKMFTDGAVNEVKKFCKIKMNNQLSANKIIGIKEISDYLIHQYKKENIFYEALSQYWFALSVKKC